ncbi:MAG: hypothetical protein V1809_12710 [Planctomycetota bacterium]
MEWLKSITWDRGRVVFATLLGCAVVFMVLFIAEGVRLKRLRARVAAERSRQGDIRKVREELRRLKAEEAKTGAGPKETKLDHTYLKRKAREAGVADGSLKDTRCVSVTRGAGTEDEGTVEFQEVRLPDLIRYVFLIEEGGRNFTVKALLLKPDEKNPGFWKGSFKVSAITVRNGG